MQQAGDLAEDLMTAKEMAGMDPRIAQELLLARAQPPVKLQQPRADSQPVVPTGAVRTWNREIATWHGWMESPSFGQTANGALSIFFPDAGAEVIYQPSAEELRAALLGEDDTSEVAPSSAGNHQRAASPTGVSGSGENNAPRRKMRTAPLPEALRQGGGHENGPWHGTIRHCDATDLCTCIHEFGDQASYPHLALDCLAQVKMRCLRKQQRALLDASVPSAVRSLMRTHAGNNAVQKLGQTVTGLLAGSSASKQQQRGASEPASVYGRYAQRAVPSLGRLEC